DSKHMFGQSSQRAAAETGAADMIDLGAVDRHDRRARAERNYQRAIFFRQGSSADSDRRELVDLRHWTSEQRCRQPARSRAGSGYVIDLFERDVVSLDQL